MTITILLVDDQAIFREGVASILNAQPDLCVVGSAGSVREAVATARTLRPDLVLMDFSLPDGTGLDATRAILTERPDASILFLTVFDEDGGLFAAIRHGAKGYVLKDASVTELLSYVRDAARGNPAMSPRMNARLMGEFRRTAPNPPDHAISVALTEREQEVLEVLATGASNDEIAAQLVISLSTVKSHVHNVLSKLNLQSRREAMQFVHARPVLRRH